MELSFETLRGGHVGVAQYFTYYGPREVIIGKVKNFSPPNNQFPTKESYLPRQDL